MTIGVVNSIKAFIKRHKNSVKIPIELYTLGKNICPIKISGEIIVNEVCIYNCKYLHIIEGYNTFSICLYDDNGFVADTYFYDPEKYYIDCLFTQGSTHISIKKF